MPTPRTFRSVVPVFVAAALVSCHIEEPFVRDNHWDPGSSATKSLSGPDSTYSLGDHFTLTLTTDPPLPAGSYVVTWVGAGSPTIQTEVLPAGNGEFVVTLAHAGYELLTVGAMFGDVPVSKTIWVGQRVDTLDLFCTGAYTASCDGTPLMNGALLSVYSRMRDGHGNAVGRLNAAMGRSTWVSRNPAVLSVAQTFVNAAATYTVHGVGAGNTWLVVTIDGKRDSVHVVVSP